MNEDLEEFYLIFEDGDPFRAEIVGAALEGAEIDCFIQNEGVQNLFSMGSMGGLNPLMGTIKVYIRAEDRARAETLMADLQAAPEEESGPESEREFPPDASSEIPPSQGKGLLSWMRQWFLK